jgi:hypothetical protein
MRCNVSNDCEVRIPKWRLSLADKQKISKRMEGNQRAKGYKRTPKEIGIIRKRMLGNTNFLGSTHSVESKRKISASFTEERREMMRLKWLGARNPLWNNGSSFLPYGKEFSRRLKQQILERDAGQCIVCSSSKQLMTHHIDYNKRNNLKENLITLCNSCHNRTNSPGLRKILQKEFVKLISLKEFHNVC